MWDLQFFFQIDQNIDIEYKNMRSIKKRTSLLTPDKGIYISRGFWVFFQIKLPEIFSNS